MPHIHDGISGNKLIEEINNYSIDSRGKVTGYDEEGNPIIAEDNTQEINSNLNINGDLDVSGELKVTNGLNVKNNIEMNNSKIYGLKNAENDDEAATLWNVVNEIQKLNFSVLAVQRNTAGQVVYYDNTLKNKEIAESVPYGDARFNTQEIQFTYSHYNTHRSIVNQFGTNLIISIKVYDEYGSSSSPVTWYNGDIGYLYIKDITKNTNYSKYEAEGVRNGTDQLTFSIPIDYFINKYGDDFGFYFSLPVKTSHGTTNRYRINISVSTQFPYSLTII